MATEPDGDALRIHTDSDYEGVDVRAFIEMLTNSLTALEEIDKEMSEFGTPQLEWRVVSATTNSPMQHTIRGYSTKPERRSKSKRVVQAFVDGVRHLEKSNTRPKFFNENALRAVSNLRRGSTKGVTVNVETDQVSGRVTRELEQNAEFAIQVLRGEKLGADEDYGYVEGTLYSVTGGNDTDRGVLQDNLSRVQVKVTFAATPEMDDAVRRAWKRRVGLSGKAMYDRDANDVVSIRVTSAHDIEVFDDDADLPDLDDLQGIDITGGVESSDFVRGMRDDYEE
jgi:hypothetical protein